MHTHDYLNADQGCKACDQIRDLLEEHEAISYGYDRLRDEGVALEDPAFSPRLNEYVRTILAGR